MSKVINLILRYFENSIYLLRQIYINSLNDWLNCFYFSDYYFFFEIDVLFIWFFFLKITIIIIFFSIIL